MKTRALLLGALLPLLCGGSLNAQGQSQTWASPCTLDVVLVTSFLCLEAMAVVFWISQGL